MYQLLFTLFSAWHHLLSVLTIEAQSSPGSINKTKILPGTSKLMLFSIILFKQSSVCSEESCNHKKVTGYSIILIPIQDVIVYITDYRIISFWPWSLINLLFLKADNSSWISLSGNYQKVISSLNFCVVFKESPCSKQHILVQAQTVPCFPLPWHERLQNFSSTWAVANTWVLPHTPPWPSSSSSIVHFRWKSFNILVPPHLAAKTLTLQRNDVTATVQNEKENSKTSG